MGYVDGGARVSCSLIGGLCVAQVSLKVHRWVEGHLHVTCYPKDDIVMSNVVLAVACRRSAVLCSFCAQSG
jgi:hypothetical protein